MTLEVTLKISGRVRIRIPVSCGFPARLAVLCGGHLLMWTLHAASTCPAMCVCCVFQFWCELMSVHGNTILQGTLEMIFEVILDYALSLPPKSKQPPTFLQA